MFRLTNFMMLGTFHQIIWVVNSLSARQNFLASHKHIIRIGIFGVVGIWHGVERSDSERELVQHVKVSIVLGLHQATEQLLIGSRHILFITHFNAGVAQHFNALVELKLEWWLEELEGINIVLLTNGCNFRGVARKKSINVSQVHWKCFALTCHEAP